jgi:hypothetical protein
MMVWSTGAGVSHSGRTSRRRRGAFIFSGPCHRDCWTIIESDRAEDPPVPRHGPRRRPSTTFQCSSRPLRVMVRAGGPPTTFQCRSRPFRVMVRAGGPSTTFQCRSRPFRVMARAGGPPTTFQGGLAPSVSWSAQADHPRRFSAGLATWSGWPAGACPRAAQRPDLWAGHDTTGMGVPRWSTCCPTDP